MSGKATASASPATTSSSSTNDGCTVRLSSGVLIVITQPVNPNLRSGMPVYVEGSGEQARVVPK